MIMIREQKSENLKKYAAMKVHSKVDCG